MSNGSSLLERKSTGAGRRGEPAAWFRRLVRAVLNRAYLARWLPNSLRLRAWRCLGVEVGANAFIAPEAKLACFPERIRIGEGSLIAGGAELYAWGRIEIGRRTLISQGVKLLTGTHNYNSPHFEGIAKQIRVGDYVWVGAYALILPGVTIGNEAVVGAGTVVTREVPPRAIVAGNPAQVIGEREQTGFAYCPAEFP